MATDPNLIRCGNCGETWEAHEYAECGHCGKYTHVCPGVCILRHVEHAQFREETDADRQAQWASARGL